ncbi:hypothetical protein [Rathayibacter festucae]|uniref:hypothetical protein n=1 Tax=Rathayibacter festucae TaxID=110937 RepID=UPI002A69F384|nr:hypothetical protein [Rathayibacter festucae]MDY0912757.1 hypothetical protein [Rathayibacter festucae]
MESLKEVASKIGRVETMAHRVGRVPQRTRRVARLMVGLGSGSTTVRVHRAGTPDALDFESEEETAFDDTFASLLESVARNDRPLGVGEPLALATAHLIDALQLAAPEVEFAVDGSIRGSVATSTLQRDLWHVPRRRGADVVEVRGRLYSANLHTHRFRLEDAVGSRIDLSSVMDDSAAARLLDATVIAVGVPEYDSDGELVSIRNVSISAADVLADAPVPSAVPIEQILASAPGPDAERGLDLTDDDVDSFLRAIRE